MATDIHDSFRFVLNQIWRDNMIIPCNDRILIKPIKMEAKSGGGIVLGGGLKDERLHGIVMAIGQGRMAASGKCLVTFQGKVGDEVIYGNVTTTVDERLDNGDECILVMTEAIVGIISHEK